MSFTYEEINNISHRSIIKLIDKFLLGLRDDHTLSYRDYDQLLGIGYWAREYNFLTFEQKWYAMNTLSENEDQLDPFKIYM